MYHVVTFPKQQILDSSKIKEFADDNVKFDEDNNDFSKGVENIVGKGEIACYKQFLFFLHSVFKSLLQLTHKKKGLCGKGLNKMYCKDPL